MLRFIQILFAGCVGQAAAFSESALATDDCVNEQTCALSALQRPVEEHSALSANLLAENVRPTSATDTSRTTIASTFPK